jgi:hypothetical protein
MSQTGNFGAPQQARGLARRRICVPGSPRWTPPGNQLARLPCCSMGPDFAADLQVVRPVNPFHPRLSANRSRSVQVLWLCLWSFLEIRGPVEHQSQGLQIRRVCQAIK